MHKTTSERALILAPHGRDAALAAAMLQEGEIAADCCSDAAELACKVGQGVGFVVVTEEALDGADLQALTAKLDGQEPWSDIPFILLTRRGGGLERNPQAGRHSANLRNVTFLERPFHPTSLLSLATAALRARRRQYDARLRITEISEREMDLRVALEAGQLAPWSLQLADMRLDASNACKAIYGRGPDEPFGWADFVAGIDVRDRDAVEGEIVRSIKSNQNHSVEFRFNRPDGSLRWVQVQGRSLRGDGGWTERASGVARDVTDQHHAQERLRASERQFRTLADSMPALCWIADGGGAITWYNQRWYEFTGTRPEDMTGWGWQAVHDPAVLPEVMERWSHSIATGESFEMVFPLRAATGQYRPHLTRVVPMRSDDGRVTGWIGTNTDITDQHAAEVALRDLADELEQRVEERTRLHAETTAQLHEAQKIETLGQLTGGVAHDFNNLLTPVMGALDMLGRLHQDERSQRLIRGAQEASDRSRTLISRLLAFARRQVLAATAVDVGKLVEGIADLIRRSLGPQIAMSLDLDRSTPAAWVDANQLELALLNLAVNARDAMPDGGELTISVRFGPGSPGADACVLLEVTDTGTGMDAMTLARAIEPFFSTKTVGKGTGLGLSMVHGLAAQSGGKLVLASTPGEGTVATLSLPVAASAGPDEADPAPPGEEAMPPLQVLLVDDHELARHSTAEMLTEMGHSVTQCGSAEEALEVIAGGGFELVVSDYLMPGMTGSQFRTHLHRATPCTPFVLISGFADSETADRATGLLAKPFTRAELARAMIDSMRAQAPTPNPADERPG